MNRVHTIDVAEPMTEALVSASYARVAFTFRSGVCFLA